jgi:hypothetical protein
LVLKGRPSASCSGPSIKPAYNLAVDGDFGPKTEQAVIDFQKQHGLKTDGIAGSKTLGALANAQPRRMPTCWCRSSTSSSELASPYSRLSVAIGVAKGTRTPDGGRIAAYRGHVDPKRGYNVGTFSYQHQASSPGQADQTPSSRSML